MKKLKFLITLLLPTIGLQSCSDDEKGGRWVDPDIPAIDKVVLSRSEQNAKNGLNEFGFDLMQNISAESGNSMATKDKGNIIISPFSAGVCMSLIANSCQQNQANAIADILHCNDLEALNTLSNKLIRSISHI